MELKPEHKREVLVSKRKNGECEVRIKQKEQSVAQKESALDKQLKDIDSIKENLNRKIEVVNTKRTELEKHLEEHIR